MEANNAIRSLIKRKPKYIKTSFLKMPCLWPGRKLGKLRNLGIHGNFFLRFLNLTLNPPYRQNRKLGNKKTRNNYFIKKETPTKVFL